MLFYFLLMNLTKFLKVKMIVNFGLNDTFKIKDHKRHEVYVIHFLDKKYLADNQFFTRPIISQRLQFSLQELCWDGSISNNKSLSWHLGRRLPRLDHCCFFWFYFTSFVFLWLWMYSFNFAFYMKKTFNTSQSKTDDISSQYASKSGDSAAGRKVRI